MRGADGGRAVLYARYSTDMQNDQSIEDQFAVCRAYANRQGYEVVDTYADRAISGAEFHGRPGLQRLLTDAHKRLFDVVIAESMSRIGRDIEYRAHVSKRLQYVGIKMLTPSDGVVTPLIDQIRGIFDSQTLVDLKAAVWRGNAGVARDGRHPGGRRYGYRARTGADRRGVLEIYEPEAEVVRRIFRDYAAERTPRDIAGDLNREGIPSPRGGRWNASTINGNRKRCYGILLNPLYDGRMVYNRTHHVRNPMAIAKLGQKRPARESRVNPATDWQFRPVEHLRIIDKPLWDKVQQRKELNATRPTFMARRPKHLLSGLLRCGVCGSGMAVRARHQGVGRVRCSRATESQTCSNGRNFPLDEIIEIVVNGMREQLQDRGLVELYVRTFNEERQRHTAEADRNEGTNREKACRSARQD